MKHPEECLKSANREPLYRQTTLELLEIFYKHSSIEFSTYDVNATSIELLQRANGEPVYRQAALEVLKTFYKHSSIEFSTYDIDTPSIERL